MFHDEEFRARHRYGSSRWADAEEAARAGLFGAQGAYLGHLGQRTLRFDSDAPLITIAGAGAGKLTTVIAGNVCNAAGTPMLICDPRGEIAALSLHTLAPAGEYGYCWGPVPMHGLPQHACNALDILEPDSLSLHPDTKFIMEGLIPLSGSANGHYFELRAREWCGDICMALVERYGSVSLPALYSALCDIEANPSRWADLAEFMLGSRFENVRRTAAEILTKREDSEREYGAIMGEIFAHLGFLSDPALQAALEGRDFSLSCLTDPERVSKVYLNVPAEYLSLWSPVIRLFFTVTMLYKGRAPSARRILLLADEAGQMGRFEALLRAFTFGRGAGVRAWAFFQDIGQIERHYGRAAVQGFLGSAQVRQFFGVRDPDTARLVSDMLGSETLETDDTLNQSDARRKRQNLMRVVIEGADPFEAAADFGHHDFATNHRVYQARPLLTPAEVLALPEDKQVLFISGKNLHPLLADRYPYFTRREFAGRYLANPYHPPVDRVRIATRFGSKWARVIERPVSPEFRDFPQHAGGIMRFVEGYPI